MDRTVFLTGGSSGVGASLVTHLAAQGYHVVTAARRARRMNRMYGEHENVDVRQLDLADLDAVDALCQDLLDEHGHVPYVINCASTWTPKPVHKITREDLTYSFTVDAFARVRIMQAFLPAMRREDFGRIVNFSGMGLLMPSAGWALEYASVWASNAFTVAAALENRDRNIKINLTSPGPANTEMGSGPREPEDCHPTIDHLLELPEDGPTGTYVWMGYEIPLFPDLGDTDLMAEEVTVDEELFAKVL